MDFILRRPETLAIRGGVKITIPFFILIHGFHPLWLKTKNYYLNKLDISVLSNTQINDPCRCKTSFLNFKTKPHIK